MTAIDAVLFDLDGTICDYRRPGSDVLATAFERAGVDPVFTVEDYLRGFDDYAEPGQPIDAQRAACFAGLAADRGLDREAGVAVARVYATERDHRDVAFRPGADAALSTLAADHRLGLVTNGAPGMQATKLDALDIADAFETIVHGGHDAPAKPAPEPFHRALEALEVPPERAVHVGNSRAADVAGAKAAGLRAAWLGDADDLDAAPPTPDFVLESLADLLDPPWTG